MLNIFKQKKKKFSCFNNGIVEKNLWIHLYAAAAASAITSAYVCEREQFFLWNNFLEKNEKFPIA